MFSVKFSVDLRLLDEACLLESCVCTILVDGLDSASRNGKNHCLLQFRNINALLLEVELTSNFTSRVILGCTSAVRISAADQRCSFCYWAGFSHILKSVAKSYHIF